MNRIWLSLLLCITITGGFGQNIAPKSIEGELLRLFKKIDYRSQDNADANDIFGKRLKYYAEKFPFTLTQKFAALQAEHLDISTSADSSFRIYSWDTWTGGTMHMFENVLQYKSGKKTNAVLDTVKSDGDYIFNYYKIYTFSNGNNTYYLAVYRAIGSTKDVGEGVQVFAIENGKLNNDVRIIRTKTGLHSQLSYSFDFFSEVDWKVRPSIYFNAVSKTIVLPLIDGNNNMTHKSITYKFTGKYFEKLK